jgi:hypothetical protein
MSSSKAAAVKTARRPKQSLAPKAAAPIEADGSASAEAMRLAAELEQALVDGRPDVLTPEALQALMAALCKTYSAQIAAGSDHTPLEGRNSATSTDIMTTASGLLRAANLAVFELGMWQSWTGR